MYYPKQILLSKSPAIKTHWASKKKMCWVVSKNSLVTPGGFTQKADVISLFLPQSMIKLMVMD